MSRAGRWSGKVCVVTGATGGIGLALARSLAAEGAKLVLTARDPERARAAEIGLAQIAPRGLRHWVHVDLSRMRDTARAGAKLRARFPAIHLLVNNAGAVNGARELTAEGLERTFATNHLAYLVLARALEPSLAAAAPSRIVNVASNAHRRGRVRLDDLQLERGYTPWRAYAQSKLANVLFARELSRRLPPGVSTLAVHPGVVATGFARELEGPIGAFFRVFRPLLTTAEDSAKALLHLCSAEDLGQPSGAYFEGSRPSRPSRQGRDDALALALWERSSALLESLGVGAT